MVAERSDSSEEESEDDSKSVSSVGSLTITLTFLTLGPSTQ